MIPGGEKKTLGLLIGVLFFSFSIVPSQAELTLDTSLSVSELYTDNLFFTFANKRDDFGTFLTPRFTLTYSNKYIEFAGSYAARGQVYINNSQANTLGHGSNFMIDLPFLNRISKRLEVRINESFNLTPEQPGFSGNSSQFPGRGIGGGAGGGGVGASIIGGPGVGGLGGAGVGGIGAIGDLGGNSLNNQGIINRRGTSTFQNRARIRVGYNFSPRFDGDVQYSNTFRGGTQESMTHTIRTNLSFGLSEKTRLNGGYSLRITDFSGSGGTSGNIQAPGGNGNATSHSLSLGAHHKLQPTIPIQVRVAATVTETETATTRLNFTGNGSISKNFSDGIVSLRVNQRIGAGGGFAASTTLNQTAVLIGSKSLTRFLSGFLQFAYSRNRSLAGRAIDADTYQFQGGMNYMILEWLSGGVTYSYRNQDSTGLFGNSAQSNQIFIGLTAAPETIRLFK